MHDPKYDADGVDAATSGIVRICTKDALLSLNHRLILCFTTST